EQDYQKDWENIQSSLLVHYKKTNQGQREGDMHRRSAALWERLTEKTPNDSGIRRKVAGQYHLLGTMLMKSSQAQEAEKVYRQALVHKEKLVSDFPDVL